MKTCFKLLMLSLLMMLIGTTVQAQVTASANAHAKIITTITLTKTVDLDFGNLAVTSVAGTVLLTAADPPTRTITGGVTLPVVTGTVTAAEFDVTGANNATYSITLPASVVITNDLSPATMLVDTFTSDQPANVGTLSGSGTSTFLVGATCHVSAMQDPGDYNAVTDFDVTVNYN
jgi:hypothetical protein